MDGKKGSHKGRKITRKVVEGPIFFSTAKEMAQGKKKRVIIKEKEKSKKPQSSSSIKGYRARSQCREYLLRRNWRDGRDGTWQGWKMEGQEEAGGVWKRITRMTRDRGRNRYRGRD